MGQTKTLAELQQYVEALLKEKKVLQATVDLHKAAANRAEASLQEAQSALTTLKVGGHHLGCTDMHLNGSFGLQARTLSKRHLRELKDNTCSFAFCHRPRRLKWSTFSDSWLRKTDLFRMHAPRRRKPRLAR